MAEEPKLTTAEQADHFRSRRDYPELNLMDDEYVLIDVRRSTVYLGLVWATVIFVFVALMVMFFVVDFVTPIEQDRVLPKVMLVFAAVLGILLGVLVSWLYRQSYMIITNTRVFCRTQHTPFAFVNQTVELEQIGNIHYKKNGILPTMFDYGTVEMSVEGSDDVSYSLSYVDQPQIQIVPILEIAQKVDKGA